MIYLEELNILLLIKLLKNIKNLSIKKNIFYIYSNKTDIIFKFFFKYILNINLKKFNFKMMDIKNEKDGEIIREIIPRENLYEFENLLNNNYDFFKKNKIISDYILKSIVGKNAHLKNSFFRLIFLINTIERIEKKNINFRLFIINNRSWFNLFYEYSKNKNIKLEHTKFNIGEIILFYFFKFNKIKNIIKDLVQLKNFEYINSNIKLYCEGKFQPNITLNGERSDFSWLMGSNFLKKNTVYNSLNINTKKKLNNYGIYTTINFERNKFKYFHSKVNYLNNKSLNLSEKIELNKICNDYDYLFNKWYRYFKTHNIRASLNWYKYDSDHIPQVNALNTLNGISTLQQLNFEGHRNYYCKSNFDICFYFSKFSTLNDEKNKSKIKYKVITGIPNYEINQITKNNAIKIKQSLYKNGAENIVCVLDENSRDDHRFHTGHDLQKENYFKIIQELLNNKKLGLVFKPKNPSTLKYRLGKYSQLLDKAVNTGRCFIFNTYEKEGAPFSKTTPLQASLSSDLVIHSALSAGTAALETVSNGIPTIMIDRERNYKSIFYEKLGNNVIFNDWESAISATNKYFFKNEFKTLGDWADSVSYFDPFLDNKSQKRIGNFLDLIIQGLNDGMDNDKNINKVINEYKLQWGDDKVIVN